MLVDNQEKRQQFDFKKYIDMITEVEKKNPNDVKDPSLNDQLILQHISKKV
jgi:hypothetical protein